MGLRTILDRIVKPRFIEIQGLRIIIGPLDGAPPVPGGVIRALRRGDYERDERSVIEKSLKQGDAVLEIGAGIGVVTGLCCRIAGSENVTVYEANPELALRLAANCEANGFSPTIHVRPVAAKAGRVDFNIGRNFLGSSLHGRPGLTKRLSLEADGFGEIFERLRPTYLVMDVEGAETSLLTSLDSFGPLRAICLETHPHIVGEDRIEAMIAHLTRRGFAIGREPGESRVMFLEREPEH